MLKSYRIDENGYVVAANTIIDVNSYELLANGNEPFINDISNATNYRLIDGVWVELNQE